jgi:site-specific DNA recombinase
MIKPAAIYARVSSDRQKEDHTIASQTAALIQYAETEGFAVPSEWIFQDEGYSGASIVRPGLEAVRDLAAEGHIEAVLIHAPDRLSRKYAYQVLLTEEFSKHGVEVRFVKSPSVTTPEDQLLVQFQGMIAEYERAQILERSRRGKRHRAQQGSISVLSGAPYGYRYVKKSDSTAAYYEVVEAEADVVRLVFQTYIERTVSINEITRMLNERHVPTRKGITRWERSTVWAMLRNPAYVGRACFGKTELRPRQRVTRPLRQRNGHVTRDSANHERPRQEWIEIPVPALVSETSFALAQEQLERNKHHSPRRTAEPSLLQGMLVCEKCGYALYRTSTRTTKRKLYYYRCLGADAYRHLHGAVCDNRPIRQDYLDGIVWTEILRLLDDPALIQSELDRRREAARKADPLRKRQESLHRDQIRLQKSIDRLVTAYQESLLTLEQLRQRMPALRQQEQAVQSELASLAEAAADQSRYLRLVETLTEFRTRLRARADRLAVEERQRILRLLVKEILVGKEDITIRHSISAPHSGPGSTGSPDAPSVPPNPAPSGSYLLRSGSHHRSLRSALCGGYSAPVLDHTRLKPSADQTQNPLIGNPVLQKPKHPVVIDFIEERPNVGIQNPVHLLALDSNGKRVQRIVLSTPLPESIRKSQKILFIDCVQYRDHGLLHNLVLYRGYAQRSLPTICFRDKYPSRWSCPIRPGMNQPMQHQHPLCKDLLILPPRRPVHTCRRVSLQAVKAVHE